MSNWDQIPIGAKYGWICPKCGRVMSPTMPFCPCNGQGEKTIASTGTGTGDFIPDDAKRYSAIDEDGNMIFNKC